jgi:hypothetical protein
MRQRESRKKQSPQSGELLFHAFLAYMYFDK